MTLPYIGVSPLQVESLLFFVLTVIANVQRQQDDANMHSAMIGAAYMLRTKRTRTSIGKTLLHESNAPVSALGCRSFCDEYTGFVILYSEL